MYNAGEQGRKSTNEGGGGDAYFHGHCVARPIQWPPADIARRRGWMKGEDTNPRTAE